jgi:threonylcarbamoyladenosine tRNA methylthiotransferase MtaB
MRRPYTAAQFAELAGRLHAAIDELNLGIDVIAGFPGETDAHFQTTATFVDSLPAGYLHVFPYSRRPGTPAAALPGQVPPAIKKARTTLLRRLSDVKKERLYRRCIGRTLPVLVEGDRDAAGRLKGFSHNYIPLAFAGPDDLRGCMTQVMVEQVEGVHVCGRLAAPEVPVPAARPGGRTACCTWP